MNDDRLSQGSAKIAENGHARRVTAWCAEIAGKLKLSRADQEVLGQAARLHHLSKVVLDDASWSSLRGDIEIASAPPSSQPGAVIQVLQALQGNRSFPPRIRKLARILEQCDDLDSGCELDAIISAEPEFNGLDSIVSEMARYFDRVASADFEKAAARIPVFDSIAYRAIALLGNDNTNLADVESLVAADQALAGHIVTAANSVLQDSANRVDSVRQAVIRIGMESARQIVSATSLRKLFEAKHSQALWNHSLDVAEAAANIAGRSGVVKRDQAFLAGLTHDVGKLVILNLPESSLASQERLTRSGCPDPIVERIILGEDHAAIGAARPESSAPLHRSLR